MQRITAVVFVVTLAFLTAIVFAQSGRPVSAGSADEILKKQVRPWIVEKEDTLGNLIMWTLIASRLPGGVAFRSKADEEFRFKLKPTSLELRSVLDSIVAGAPQYRWEIEKNVIIFLPAEEYPPMLNAFIPEFKVENVNNFGFIDALEAVPELQYQATALGFSNFTEPRIKCCGGLISRAFSLHLRNATLREILNAAVRAKGRGMWRYREEVSDGKRYFTVGI
jgi:hypothetical protein